MASSRTNHDVELAVVQAKSYKGAFARLKRIGLDFDNTIACYDTAFCEVALDHQLVPADSRLTKVQVRAAIIESLGEPKWTWLQGEVYGPQILKATPFPGLFDFLKSAFTLGWDVYIVSHKTRVPVIGERHDLHQAALNWIRRNHLFDIGLSESKVYFEETREQKIQRIRTLGCQVFIDDLPEVLSDPSFPPHTERWLYNPINQSGAWRQFNDWNTARSWLSPRSDSVSM